MVVLRGLGDMVCVIVLNEKVVQTDELSMVGLCDTSSISTLVTLFCIYKIYWFGLIVSTQQSPAPRRAVRAERALLGGYLVQRS